MQIAARCIYWIMKRYRKIMGRITKTAELPDDLNPHLFFVQWLGGTECVIEQHRGILDFAMQQIRFMTEQGELSVEGEDLVLEVMTASRAKVSGSIRAVRLEAKS
jgi:sporulation protein YqfC